MEKSRGSKRVVSYRRPVTNCDWSAVKREPGPFLPTEREIEWLHLAPIDKTFEFDPFERNSSIFHNISASFRDCSSRLYL